ncbi:MAG: glycosyltransferase, partial [Candidatus Omnitrophica bacterium]|nr:glycosyltransferase [Candidatus Omnitrophota bacterium]
IIVVDGGSTDETKVLVDSYSSKLKISFTTQVGGLVCQENKGWRLAQGQIVIRTDDDVITTPEWLKEIAGTFNSSSEIGGVTGPTIIPKERKEFRDLFYFQNTLAKGNFFWRVIGKIYFGYFLEGKGFSVSEWFRSGAFSLGSNYEDCLKLKGPIEVTNQEACNMAIRKDLLARISGFDESYGGIGEYNEPDVTFKIRNLGYKIIFNPKAALQHLPSKEGFFKERPASYSRIINFINFYFRHIKPDSLDKVLRFSAYLLFLNGFYIYKAITTKQLNQLGSISGTMIGLAKNIFKI